MARTPSDLERFLTFGLRRRQSVGRLRHGLPALLAFSFGAWNAAQASYGTEELVFASVGFAIASLFLVLFLRTWTYRMDDERHLLSQGDIVWVYLARSAECWSLVVNTREGRSVYFEFQSVGALDETSAACFLQMIARMHPQARIGGFRRSLLHEYRIDPDGFALRRAL